MKRSNKSNLKLNRDTIRQLTDLRHIIGGDGQAAITRTDTCPTNSCHTLLDC